MGDGEMLEMFHWTRWEAAQAILKDGFRDGTGTYMTDHEHRGVWLTDTEGDPNQGGCGDTCLKVTLDLAEEDIAGYEWIQEGLGYREWLVPAELLNAKMKVSVHDRLVEPDWAKQPLAPAMDGDNSKMHEDTPLPLPESDND